MAPKGVSEEIVWVLVVLIVMAMCAVIIFAFFSGERPSQGGEGNQTNGLANTVFRDTFCDMLYFFFGPACAYYGT